MSLVVKWCLLRCLYTCAFYAFFGNAWSVDLLTLYRIAQNDDPVFEIARHTREATEQKVPQARAGLLPALSISGNDGRTRAQTTFSNQSTVDRNVDAWTWTLQLTQPLVRLQNVFAYQQSTLQADAAEAQFTQTLHELILRLAQAYFDTLIAEEAQMAAEAQLRALDEQWRQAKRGFETGVRAITDMHEARSRRDDARALKIAAENEVEIKHSELERIVGPVNGKLAALGSAAIMPEPQPADVQQWVMQAREQNPAVRAQKSTVDAAEAEISRNRAEHLPTVDLVASRGASYSSGSLTTPLDYSTNTRSMLASVQINVPLFSGGATNARIEEAIANRSKELARLEDTRRRVTTDTRQAYAAIINGQARIEALESAQIAGENAVKGNQVGYRIGLRTNMDVLTSEQQLFATRRDLSKARYDILLQGLKLKASVGTLTESDVVEVNRLLQER